MSDKIRMSFEDACKLAFRSAEIGNTRNALEIMDEIAKQIDAIIDERDDLKSKINRIIKECMEAGVSLSPELML